MDPFLFAVIDALVRFLTDAAKGVVKKDVEKLVGKLRDDAAFKDAIDGTIDVAWDDLLKKYENPELARKLHDQREAIDTKSVRDAVSAAISQPGLLESKQFEAIAKSFAEVLPAEADRAGVDAAVRFFLGRVAERVWHLPALQPIYEMQFQRISAERAEAMVRELRGLRADFQQGMLTLVQGLGEQQKLLAAAALPALPAPPKVLNNLPNPDYVRFVGREVELARLKQLLAPENRTWVISVDGIGGIGKSALALEMAHRYLQEFDNLADKERFQAIIWASAKTAVLTADGIALRRNVTRTLEDIYTTIAVTLQREDITRASSEEQSQIVCQALARQRTLLIVDNLESIDDERVNAFLRELPSPTKCIVTTRHRIDVAYPIRLTGMPRADALTLINQESEKKSVSLTNDEADVLYHRTGGVPLAIVWSIAQMGYGYGVNAMLRRLGDATGDINRYCFASAVESLGSKPAYRLLMALSLFKTDASRDALGYVADLAKLDQEEGLVDLERLSLVNKSGDRFSLLPLTRDYIIDLLERDLALARYLRQRWVDYYSGFITHRRFGDDLDQQLLEAERENLIEVIEQVWSEQQIKMREDLLNQFFIFLWRRGYWEEAVRQASRLLTWAKENHQIQWQARFEHWLGRLYLYQGNLERAERRLRSANLHYGEDSWQWVSVQTYRAQVSLRNGSPRRAERILSRALTKAREQEGESGRGTARIYNVFAEIRLGDGHPVEAQSYLMDALEICEGKINHVTVLGRTYHLLGQVEMRLGHPQAADIWATRYLELALKEGFVQEIALARFDLAQSRHELGKHDEAHQLAEEAFNLFAKLGMKTEFKECADFLRRIDPKL